jgi:predicted  nucleic acid-binding Zn-ribbon protein
MNPMSDQPITLAVLAQFHRDVVVPDMHRTFENLFERLVRPRFDEIDGRFDAVFHKLDKLETEYEALKAGLRRVEDRVEQMDLRLGALEAQYRDLLGAVNRLEERLSRVEKQLDAVVAAQEKEPVRGELADLRARVDVLQLQVRNLEKRFDR